MKIFYFFLEIRLSLYKPGEYVYKDSSMFSLISIKYFLSLLFLILVISYIKYSIKYLFSSELDFVILSKGTAKINSGIALFSTLNNFSNSIYWNPKRFLVKPSNNNSVMKI